MSFLSIILCNGVIPPFAERVAPQQALQTESHSFHGSVSADCIEHVLRARGGEPARGNHPWRNKPFVEAQAFQNDLCPCRVAHFVTPCNAVRKEVSKSMRRIPGMPVSAIRITSTGSRKSPFILRKTSRTIRLIRLRVTAVPIFLRIWIPMRGASGDWARYISRNTGSRFSFHG